MTIHLLCVWGDSHIWVKLKGIHFAFENDLYICIAYIIPVNSSRQSFSESDVFDYIYQFMIDIHETLT